jgi:hypothetical protein
MNIMQRHETWNGNEQKGPRGMTTSRAVSMLVLAGFILSIGTACREKPNKYRRFDKFKVDGGLVLRPECEQPGIECADKCLKRQASSACFGCCGDQDVLCITQQPYDYSYCDGAR